MAAKSNTNAIIFDSKNHFPEFFFDDVQRLNLFESIDRFNDEDALIDFFISNKVRGNTFIFTNNFLKNLDRTIVIKHLRRLKKNTKVIIITDLNDSMLIKDILKHAPNAILSSTAPIEEISEAINAIKKGETYISQFIKEIID